MELRTTPKMADPSFDRRGRRTPTFWRKFYVKRNLNFLQKGVLNRLVLFNVLDIETPTPIYYS